MSLGLFQYEGIFEAQTVSIDIDGTANPPLNHSGLANLTLDDHTQYALETGRNTTESAAHIVDTSNPHSVTMNQVTPTTTTGDIIYADAPTTVDRLAIGASDNQALVVDTGIPSWGPILDTGTWNATITNLSGNLALIGSASGMYMRIGNRVMCTFSGSTFQVTGAGPQSVDFRSSVPIPRISGNFNSNGQGIGSGQAHGGTTIVGMNQPIYIRNEFGAGTETMDFRFMDEPAGTTNYIITATFMYSLVN